MEYRKAIRVLSSGDRNELERGDILIKEMSRLTTDILNYRYISEHYKGVQEKVMIDNVNKIKNSLAILLGDMEVYMDCLNISNDVTDKKRNRITKIADKKQKGGL